MKTILLILFSILAASVFAQELKPRAVEPIRVEIVTQGEAPHDQELDKLVRAELQKSRGVIVSRRAGTAIHFAVAEITSRGQRTGFSSALLVLNDGDVAYLSVFIEGDLPSLARRMAEHLKQELSITK